MAFRATVLPMLMSESRVLMISETLTARKGMFKRGEACESQPEKGAPL